MLAYYHYTLEGAESIMDFKNNERLLNAYKSHCNANIFDWKYNMQTLRESQGLVDISDYSKSYLIVVFLMCNRDDDNERILSCINRSKQYEHPSGSSHSFLSSRLHKS